MAGPVGLFVKFSTLQDYGVDKVFFLENDNLDASQKNVIFLASGEKASQCIAIAGMYVVLSIASIVLSLIIIVVFHLSRINWTIGCNAPGQKVDCVDIFLLYLISLDPQITTISQHDL